MWKDIIIKRLHTRVLPDSLRADSLRELRSWYVMWSFFHPDSSWGRTEKTRISICCGNYVLNYATMRNKGRKDRGLENRRYVNQRLTEYSFI